MWRFILMTFVFLGWSFYELSDGSDFQPEERIATSDNARDEIQTIAQENITTETTTSVVAAQVDTPAARPVEISLPQTTTLASLTLASQSAPNNTLAIDAEKARILTQTQDPTATLQQVSATIPQPEKIKDIRAVRGTRVNMRGGPGTRYSVLAKLTKGMQVEILRIPGDGWVKLRVVDSGRVGWMAERLVTLAAN